MHTLDSIVISSSTLYQINYLEAVNLINVIKVKNDKINLIAKVYKQN